jgi:alpha-glucosidase
MSFKNNEIHIDFIPLSNRCAKMIISNGKPFFHKSFAIIHEPKEKNHYWNFKINDKGCFISWKGKNLTIFSNFRFDEGFIIFENILEKDDNIYGFGERALRLDRKFKKIRMWNLDQLDHLNGGPMYKSIPFYISAKPGKNYGFFIDYAGYIFFDTSIEDSSKILIGANTNYLVCYIITGESIKDIIEEYIKLTGRPCMPPKWALGYHQSRWSYETQEEVLSMAKEFRKREIPCDAIYLDIDYMDNYKIFTWNKENFPNPELMIKQLHDLGFKVVTIVDVGIKEENGYFAYNNGIEKDAFIKSFNMKKYLKGTVWPGICVFPDFLRSSIREWWADLHKDFLNIGIDGIWNDMNEPAIFYIIDKVEKLITDISNKFNNKKYDEININPIGTVVTSQSISGSLKNYIKIDAYHLDDEGKIVDHNKIHNAYPLLECIATKRAFEKYKPNKRPFILSRSAFSGIQKYAAVWTGDNTADWLHLEISIPMLLNLGLSGVPFCGADIGGFYEDAEQELFVRWFQLGVFYPLFRNHSSKGTRRREPWTFKKPYANYIVDAIKLRYALFPYIYKLFYEAYERGYPIMRPLFFEFPEDKESYNINDEFMFGNSLLIAPITKPSIETRAVYLPKVKWMNWKNKKIYDPGWILEKVSINEIPMFIKENGIIITTDPINYIGEKKIDNIYLETFLTKNASTIIYDDNGETKDFEKGKYFLGFLNIKKKNNEVNISFKIINKNFMPEWEFLKIKILNGKKIKKATINKIKKSIEKINDIAIINLNINELIKKEDSYTV